MAAILASLAILCCGCSEVVSAFSDVQVLLQGQSTVSSLNKEDKFPNLDDVWNAVKAGAMDISQQVGEITAEVGHEAEQVSQTMQNVSSGVVKRIAKALSTALGVIKHQADVLFNLTMKEKNVLLVTMNHTAVESKHIWSDFDTATTRVLTAISVEWAGLKDTISAASKAVTDGLTAAGQDTIARGLDQDIAAALLHLDEFLSRVKDSGDQLAHHVDLPDYNEAQSILRQVNSQLTQGLEDVQAFDVKFQDALQDFIDRILNVFVLSQHELNTDFAPVHHNITSITWRVRSASREMILGVQSSINLQARLQNMTLPSAAPTLPSAAPAAPLQSGALERTGAGLALLLLGALLAGL